LLPLFSLRLTFPSCSRALGPVSCIRWQKKGEFLLTTSLDKTAIVYDMTNTNATAKTYTHHTAPVIDGHWRNETTFALASLDKSLSVCSTTQLTPFRVFTHTVCFFFFCILISWSHKLNSLFVAPHFCRAMSMRCGGTAQATSLLLLRMITQSRFGLHQWKSERRIKARIVCLKLWRNTSALFPVFLGRPKLPTSWPGLAFCLHSFFSLLSRPCAHLSLIVCFFFFTCSLYQRIARHHSETLECRNGQMSSLFVQTHSSSHYRLFPTERRPFGFCRSRSPTHLVSQRRKPCQDIQVW
jgi:hypothetical protein